MKLKHIAFVATLLSAVAVTPRCNAQTSEDIVKSSSKPVAYVYVSRPTHVDGFSVSSNGTLIPVPGSPFANISISHMSVTEKFLFGSGDDQQNIYGFSIGSKGSLTPVSITDVQNPSPGQKMGPTAINPAGSVLYNIVDVDSYDDALIQAYKIQLNGQLQYVGTTSTGVFGAYWDFGAPQFLGSGKYAYQYVCAADYQGGGGITRYRVSSSGLLVFEGEFSTLPKTKAANDFYCPESIAIDPTNHLAVAALEYENDDESQYPPAVLFDFTAASNGKLNTKSTYKNVPETGFDRVHAMSISPTGKLLAVGGNGGGLEVFHFNGSSQATKFTGILQASESFQQFGWDKSNHLYALSENALHVYIVTPSKITEAPGSPISIPKASSVIVQTE